MKRAFFAPLAMLLAVCMLLPVTAMAQDNTEDQTVDSGEAIVGLSGEAGLEDGQDAQDIQLCFAEESAFAFATGLSFAQDATEDDIKSGIISLTNAQLYFYNNDQTDFVEYPEVLWLPSDVSGSFQVLWDVSDVKIGTAGWYHAVATVKAPDGYILPEGTERLVMPIRIRDGGKLEIFLDSPGPIFSGTVYLPDNIQVSEGPVPAYYVYCGEDMPTAVQLDAMAFEQDPDALLDTGTPFFSANVVPGSDYGSGFTIDFYEIPDETQQDWYAFYIEVGGLISNYILIDSRQLTAGPGYLDGTRDGGKNSSFPIVGQAPPESGEGDEEEENAPPDDESSTGSGSDSNSNSNSDNGDGSDNSPDSDDGSGDSSDSGDHGSGSPSSGNDDGNDSSDSDGDSNNSSDSGDHGSGSSGSDNNDGSNGPDPDDDSGGSSNADDDDSDSSYSNDSSTTVWRSDVIFTALPVQPVPAQPEPGAVPKPSAEPEPELEPEPFVERDTETGVTLSGVRVAALIEVGQPLVVSKSGVTVHISVKALAGLGLGDEDFLSITITQPRENEIRLMVEVNGVELEILPEILLSLQNVPYDPAQSYSVTHELGENIPCHEEGGLLTFTAKMLGSYVVTSEPKLMAEPMLEQRTQETQQVVAKQAQEPSVFPWDATMACITVLLIALLFWHRRRGER